MFWNKKKRAQTVEDIAFAAYNSSLPGNQAVELDFATWTPTVVSLFERYGTTELGFKDYIDPRMFTGYMSYRGSYEFLVVLIVSRGKTTVIGYRPPEDYGQDMFSLIKKGTFQEEVIGLLRSG